MFRRITLKTALALTVVATLGACATQSTAPKTVASVAAQSKDLTTFNKLVADAGLTSTLNGAGPFTVFAPSDAAFKAVPAKTLDALKADKEQLKAVLSYHIATGNLTAANAKAGKVKTLQGSDITLSRAANFLTVEEGLVEQADMTASNGVVHVIDTVLMPPKKK
ncbi:fasciclin domain-containing protein [Diaphorobacter sp.]|uniref:fasciclin domain-containing protein n=1 Tax=Diaphorobacter sp. TaxID=1934310 RepID=UPI003D0D0CA4